MSVGSGVQKVDLSELWALLSSLGVSCCCCVCGGQHAACGCDCVCICALTLANVASQLALGIPDLCLPSSGAAGSRHAHPAFIWVLEIRTPVLMLLPRHTLSVLMIWSNPAYSREPVKPAHHKGV